MSRTIKITVTDDETKLSIFSRINNEQITDMKALHNIDILTQLVNLLNDDIDKMIVENKLT